MNPLLPPHPSKPYRVHIQKDIVYGIGAIVEENGAETVRELKLDMYQPIRETPVPTAAVILAFGGAFHRGSKEDDAYGVAPQRNNSIAWYCNEFARRGYFACAIDYRLIPENPLPGSTPVVSNPEHIPRSRVDAVRKIMGLPPASNAMLWHGIEAASDDMAMAVRFVKTQAQAWNIDPEKLVIGGFSAGARTALNVAFGEKEPVAAVIALSGYMDAKDIDRHLASSQNFPSLLLISAENDLDYIVTHTSDMVDRFKARGLHCEYAQVPNATHFYPADAIAIHESAGATTVEGAMATFLQQVLSS